MGSLANVHPLPFSNNAISRNLIIDLYLNVYFFLLQHPKETYGYALIFSLSGYLGIQIVLTLVQCCDAFVAATVTTCRKAVTIAMSFLLFYKPFTFQYLWSGLIVLLGIYINIYSKNQSRSDSLTLRKVFTATKHWLNRQNRIQRQLMTNV